MVAGDPHQGGATWAVLQWVLGLRRLGHDVWLVEPVRELSDASVAYFRDVVRSFDLDGRAGLLAPDATTIGARYADLVQAARGADLLVNVAGMLVDGRLFEPIPTRLYLDLDPAFTQHWQAQGIDMRLEGHTHFATVGLRVGTVGCAVPTCGRDWLHTLPPVVLDRWPVAQELIDDAFTSVGNWRSYGSLEVDGVRYGQKAHAVRALIELPERSTVPVSLAFSIHPDEQDDLAALAKHGWRLLDPAVVASSPAAYQAFVAGSRAELGIAKEGYVVSQCGWFSDRSACYLASGRPVLALDTGFGAGLPGGEGLLPFGSVDEALGGIEAIASDYERHRHAARALAEGLLDSDVVLGRLLACL